MESDKTNVEETFKPKPNKRPTIGTVNCNELNLRSEPSAYGDILRVLRNEEAVIINGESGRYFKATIDGITGYCMKEFVTLN